MTTLSQDELRAIIGRSVERYRSTPGDAPPPQLIEAMIGLETGDTNDYGLVQPQSGAIGLGQIMTSGMEWDLALRSPEFRARWGDVSPSRLVDPEFNVDVMVNGMNARQEMGGALTDWYMAAASYLGGATTDGFNEAEDTLGTSGREYVLGVQTRISDNWGKSYTTGIDALQPGAVIDPKNVFSSYYDPNVLYNWRGVPGSNFTDIESPATAEEIYNLEQFGSGPTTVGDVITGGVLDWPRQVAAAAREYLPRVGLFLLGVVLIVGAVFLVRR